MSARIWWTTVEHFTGIHQNPVIDDTSRARSIVVRSDRAEIGGQISRQDLNAAHHQLSNTTHEATHGRFSIDLITIGTEGEPISGRQIVSGERKLRFKIHSDVEPKLIEKKTDLMPLAIV